MMRWRPYAKGVRASFGAFGVITAAFRARGARARLIGESEHLWRPGGRFLSAGAADTGRKPAAQRSGKMKRRSGRECARQTAPLLECHGGVLFRISAHCRKLANSGVVRSGEAISLVFLPNGSSALEPERFRAKLARRLAFPV